MWILGRSCDEPRTSLRIDLPPGTYFAPRFYDVAALAVLARLLGDAGPKVRDTLVMTWRQADSIEALGRIRGDGHRSDALWALHSDAGAPLPPGPSELKSLIAARFASLQPRWVLILDPEASVSHLGWLEAHVKMPLVSWLGRLLGDERHPLHAAAVDRLDVHALATMTSDPLEIIEIVEKAVEHRLTYAFPAGIPSGKVVFAPVNVEAIDWSRSLRAAAARRLASRVNKLAAETRTDAARTLLRLEVSAERRAGAIAELVRAGLVLPPSAASDGRLALARTVLDDEDSLIVFRDALDLPEEDRRAIDRDGPPRRVGMLGAHSAPVAASLDIGQDPVAQGEVPQHYEELRQAAAAKHPLATALVDLGGLLHRSNVDPSQVTSLYERAIAVNPRSANALNSFADFLCKERRDFNRAQELYERAIAADPKHVRALNGLAFLLRVERHDFDRAQELYERAIAADPPYAGALNDFATFLREERRDLDRAQALYERAIAVDPRNADALNNFANFLRVERRDLDRAQELYERAIAANPKHALALNNFATFLREERRDLDRAQELYERAIAADPTDAAALGNFAYFLWVERRDLDRAQELFERAAAIDPQYMNTLNNFATFLCDERRDFDRAQQLYERAIAAAPKDMNTLANFAHMLFLAGRRPAAFERLREAIRQADAAPPPLRSDLASELAFYRAVHLPEERDAALQTLRSLVARGARSLGWNFRAHALLAEKAGDADAPLFFALADVLSGKADASVLAAFPRWTQVSSE